MIHDDATPEPKPMRRRTITEDPLGTPVPLRSINAVPRGRTIPTQTPDHLKYEMKQIPLKKRAHSAPDYPKVILPTATTKPVTPSPAPRRIIAETSVSPHTRVGSITPVAREAIDQASPGPRRSRAGSLQPHSRMVGLLESGEVQANAEVNESTLEGLGAMMQEGVAQPRDSLSPTHHFGLPEIDAPKEPAHSQAPNAERSPSPDARTPKTHDSDRELFPGQEPIEKGPSVQPQVRSETPVPNLELANAATDAMRDVRETLNARKPKDAPQDPPAITAPQNPPKTKTKSKLFKIGGTILGVVVVVGVAGAAVYFIGPAAIVATATAGLSHAAAGLLTAYHALANVMAFIGQHTAGYVFNLSPNAATAVGSVVSFIGAAAIFGAGKAAVDFVAKPKANAPVPT